MWPFSKAEESPAEQIETAKRLARKVQKDLAKITRAARAFHLEWPSSDRTDFILACYRDGLFAAHLAGISDLRDLVFDESGNCILDPLFAEDVPGGGCGRPYTSPELTMHSQRPGDLDLDADGEPHRHRDVEIPYSGFGGKCGGGISDGTDTMRYIETGKVF